MAGTGNHVAGLEPLLREVAHNIHIAVRGHVWPHGVIWPSLQVGQPQRFPRRQRASYSQQDAHASLFQRLTAHLALAVGGKADGKGHVHRPILYPANQLAEFKPLQHRLHPRMAAAKCAHRLHRLIGQDAESSCGQPARHRSRRIGQPEHRLLQPP